MFSKKIIIKYEDVKGVYEPYSVQSKGIELRDVLAICKRFVYEGTKALNAENKAKIKEIKASKEYSKNAKTTLIKLISDPSVSSEQIKNAMKILKK